VRGVPLFPCALIQLVTFVENRVMNQLGTDQLMVEGLIVEGRIAFIHSSWHSDIVERCRDSFVDSIARHGFAREAIDCFEVPGAFEIPLHAKLLARQGRHAAIVAAGFVVDGGIYRHEFVADTVIKALMQVQLETEVPVLSAVLTPRHFHEHEPHREFFLEHMRVKGAEAASACAAIIRSLSGLKVG
jgi:6,7-dimethyl-8-ribityllumazine synthase